MLLIIVALTIIGHVCCVKSHLQKNMYEVCWFINATYIKIYILVQIHTYYAYTHSSVSGVQLVLVSVYSILTMSAVRHFTNLILPYLT